MRYPFLAVVLLVEFGILSACARSDKAQIEVLSDRKEPVVEFPEPRLLDADMYSDESIGARFEPPDTAIATVSPDKAIVTFQNEDRSDLLETAVPEILLASYSNDVYGDEGPNGDVDLRYQDELVWAFVFRDVPPIGVGGPAGVPESGAVSPNEPFDRTCTYISVFGAQTGDFLQAFEECPGE